MWHGVVVGVLGGLALKVLYMSVASEWPAQYASARSMLESWSRGSLPRHLVFRGLPAFVTCLLATSFALQSSYDTACTAGALAATFLLVTDVGAVLKEPLFVLRRPRLIILHGTGVAITGLAIFGAHFLASVATPVMPTPRELIVSAWQALFVALAIGGTKFILTTLKPQGSPTEPLEALPPQLKKAASIASHKHDCDAAFLMALILEENLQRPPWMRKLERITPIGRRNGTYGIAQVPGPPNMSDEESIEILATRYAGFHPSWRNWSINRPELEFQIEQHNHDPEFIQRVAETYEAILGSWHHRSSEFANDGLPMITADDPKRRRNEIIIRGTSYGQLPSAEVDGNQWPVQTADSDPIIRGTWSVCVPVTSRSLALATPDGKLTMSW